MAAYCDDPKWSRGKVASGHLIADTLEELHAVATAAGIKGNWFQSGAGGGMPHYTLLVTHRDAAIDAGAQPVDRATFMRKVQEIFAAAQAQRPPAAPRRAPGPTNTRARPAAVTPARAPEQGCLL